MSQQPRDAKLKKYNELAERAKKLVAGDDEGLKDLVVAAVNARLSDTQVESLIATAARTAKIKEKTARGFVQKAKEELRRRDDASPKAKADKEAADAAAALAAKITKDAEIEQLYASCGSIAEDPEMMANLEAFVHRLGVIGEGPSIRGTYIAGGSRLSRHTAISYLRRGASASGKNHPLLKILSLFPDEDIIVISSATPQALIYEGADANDRDALKHKIILICEAAVISRKANGDEHPMAAMIRTLLSDGKLDHRIPVTQPGGAPKTIHIRRDGPVCLMLTSARDDVEPELLTRLMCSDADESDAQTTLVAAHGWSGKRAEAAKDEIERWIDFQRWLIASRPQGGYVVAIPFEDAIREAHLHLMASNSGARQLRVRRDVVAFRAAIEACAILHKAQRQTDAYGSIVATLDDYRHAHEAFDAGMAALYDLKPNEATVAALAAAIEIADDEAAPDKRQTSESYKIGVAPLRQKLGLASKSTARDRINKLVDLGALEEDEAKRGKGRGSPHFYRIRKETIEGAGGNVFPTVEAVQEIMEGGGADRTRRTKGQPIDIVGATCSSGQSSENE